MSITKIGLTIATILVIILAWTTLSFYLQISNLNAQISTLKSENYSLESQVASLKRQISSRESDISNLRSELGSLKEARLIGFLSSTPYDIDVENPYLLISGVICNVGTELTNVTLHVEALRDEAVAINETIDVGMIEGRSIIRLDFQLYYSLGPIDHWRVWSEPLGVGSTAWHVRIII